MTETGPSQTAIRTAMRRAAPYLLEAEPKVLADVFARALAGFSTDEEFLRVFATVPNAHIPGFACPLLYGIDLPKMSWPKRSNMEPSSRSS